MIKYSARLLCIWNDIQYFIQLIQMLDSIKKFLHKKYL